MPQNKYNFFQHLAKKQKNAPSRSPSKSPASPRRFSILAVPTSKTKCSCSLYPLYLAGPGPPRPTAARARALEMNGREMRRPITRRKSWSRKKMRYEVNNLPSHLIASLIRKERKPPLVRKMAKLTRTTLILTSESLMTVWMRISLEMKRIERCLTR